MDWIIGGPVALPRRDGESFPVQEEEGWLGRLPELYGWVTSAVGHRDRFT